MVIFKLSLIFKQFVSFSTEKKIFLDEFIEFGFTSLLSDGVELSQCVLCNVVLSAESMKPSKLKRHLETKHSQQAKKDVAFFHRYEAGLKRQRLDCFNKISIKASIKAMCQQ